MSPEIVTREYIRDFFKLDDSETDTALLDLVMENLKPKEYAHNSYIYRIGDDADAMYFVESGTLISRGKDGEIRNEITAGQYFGECATIIGDKHTAGIQALGKVLVYELDQDILQHLMREHSGIYGMFLRNVYTQSTEKYQKLVKVLNTKRGLGSKGSSRKMSMPMLIVNYSCVVLVFLLAFFLAPDPHLGQMNTFWLCSPVFFMVVYLLITKRALESLLLSTIYVMLLLSKHNFIGTFNEYKLYATSGVADIIIVILLMGSLTRLFSASGSINALRDIVQKRIKSAKGTMLSAFLSMALIALDEYLSVMINSACFRNILDKHKVPREKTAIVTGLTPGALCILSPFSIMGIFLAGVITIASNQSGIFLQSIRYNFGAFFMIFFILLLITEKLPLFGGLKQAHIRVKEGGTLWPDGTVINADEDHSRGRLANLFLPVLVFIASSLIAGTLAAGTLQVNVLYGMIVTLIFVFFLYVFQQYMSPEQFFNHLVNGIENMIAPVVVFIIGKCFAYGLDDLGFKTWLYDILLALIQDQVWLLPPIIFGVCTLIAALFNDHWAVYAICIPIAVGLAGSFNANIALYVGAVCAGGLLGNEIAPGNIYFIGDMLGVNPKSYHRAKLPYIFCVTAMTFCAYIIIGIFG